MYLGLCVAYSVHLIGRAGGGGVNHMRGVFFQCFAGSLIVCSCHYHYYQVRSQVNRLNDIALLVHILEPRDVTNHMESHSVTCHPTQVKALRLDPARKAGTRLTYPGGMEGWVDLVAGYLPRRCTCPQTVTDPSINRAWRRVTCWSRPTLSQTANYNPKYGKYV